MKAHQIKDAEGGEREGRGEKGRERERGEGEREREGRRGEGERSIHEVHIKRGGLKD